MEAMKNVRSAHVFDLKLLKEFYLVFESDVSASRNSSQNAANKEKLKTNEAYEGSH